ncbi:MAG: hypothetical protein WAX07_04610 [Candidatus Altiarchaeia archaeon]
MSKTNGMTKVNTLLWNILIILCIASLAGAATTTNSGSSTNTQPTNIAVDFDQTVVDSKLSPGDSGVLNLFIKNVGGMEAENVEVYLPTIGGVHIDKKQYIGQMDAGESKMIPAIIRIDDSASAGLNIIQARITYDSFDSDGDRTNGESAVWEIPIRVYANPSFQITPRETTYYKDTTEELVLEGTVKDAVKELEVKMSSSCVTVIGSSQAYIGNVKENGNYMVVYTIKPTVSGACPATLTFSYTDQAGGRTASDVSFGLNIEDGGVDFKLKDISYNPTGPGEAVNVSITIKNVGSAQAQDTTLSLDAEDPFAPMDTLEKYVGTVGGEKEATIVFPLSVSWGASTQTYTIPLTITYKIGGTTYSVKKTIGVDVSGKVILSVINVDTSTGSIRIDIANLGTRDASSVKGTLIVSAAAGNSTNPLGGRQGNRTGGFQGGNQSFNGSRQGEFNPGTEASTTQYVSYKSDIKAGKSSTFSFTASGTGVATFLIEYSGENNQRITQREMITLSSRTGAINGRTISVNRGMDTTQMALYGAAAILILFAGYKYYKKKKKKK